MDTAGEDFDKSSAARATGFMGKNSELVWIQRLAQQAVADSESDTKSSASSRARSRPGEAEPDTTRPVISDSTYHCDNFPINVSDHVDAYEMPQRHTADFLLQAYLDTVHPSFPILDKTAFIDQYDAFSNGQGINPSNSWRATLNLIFAIAAKYAHLVQADARGDERDHLIYFTRARMLGFNGDTILAHPEIQQVRISGLMAFYLAATHQINRCVLVMLSIFLYAKLSLARAWTLSGISIRYATTLGLNLRNVDRNSTDYSRESRYRIWWALCSTERMLAVMTGRSTSFLDVDCSTPLPLPVDLSNLTENLGGANVANIAVEDPRRYWGQESMKLAPALQTSDNYRAAPITVGQSSRLTTGDEGTAFAPSDALFFLCSTKLSIITNTVLNRLFRANTSMQTWAEVQSRIAQLDSQLESWRQSLPSVFDITKKQRERQFIRQRICLGFFYYSTRMIIDRPCLCRVDRRITNQSDKARDFNRVTAARCVHAARDLIEMLPDEPNVIGLYRVSPWWCLVHHLVQATAILMLELSFRAEHMPNEAEEILDAAKKAVSWLRSMSTDNLAARRAWTMCDNLLRQVAPKVGRNADDLPDGVQNFGADPTLQDPPIEDESSKYPVRPTVPYQQSGQNSTLLPHVYSAYDEFVRDSATSSQSPAEQFGSIFTTTNEMDAVLSGGPDGFDSSLADEEPHWHFDENQ